LEFSALAALVALWDCGSTASERAEMLAATVMGAFAVAGVCAEFAPACVRGRVGGVVLESALMEDVCEEGNAGVLLCARAAADNFSAAANPSSVNTVTAQTIRSPRTKLSPYVRRLGFN
jgi:hypothetical protein